MKGICNLKIIRGGKVFKELTKNNVIFDLPKLMLQEYFNKIGMFGPRIGYEGSSSIEILPAAIDSTWASYPTRWFQGLRIYDEIISESDPKDVKVPILGAGVVRGSSAPSEYALVSFSESHNLLTLQATWSLSKNLTIKSMGLCFRDVALNPSKIFGNGPTWSRSDNSSTPGYGMFRPINASKMLHEYGRYESWQAFSRGAMICSKSGKTLRYMSDMFLSNTDLGSMSRVDYPAFTQLNPDRTKMYLYQSSTEIKVYDTDTEALLGTYTLPSGGAPYCIIFEVDRTLLVRISSGTTVMFYTMNENFTLSEIAGAQFTAPRSLSFINCINNRYVVSKEGYLFGPPDPVTFAVKKFDTSENETGFSRFFSVDEMLYARTLSLGNYGNYTSPSGLNIIGFGVVCGRWMNSTALNFEEPIELLNGDTFVITYKITLGE